MEAERQLATLREDIQLTLSDEERSFLNKLDSRNFRFLVLTNLFNTFQTERQTIEKGIKFYQVVAANFEKEVDSASYLCKLGHFHLLLEEFSKALSAYQKCFQLDREYFKKTVFLYGLGMVYFHFNTFDWAIRSFKQLLLIDKSFSHSSEVHVRLAIMYKVRGEGQASLEHFQQALSRWNYCTLTPLEVQFHIAHLFEVQGVVKAAMETYHKILESPTGNPELQAKVYRQLGWLHHRCKVGSDKGGGTTKALELLQKSVDLDRRSWESWYYLGRCFASEGKSNYAFLAYRQSIERNESSADTWCSIGVLYQQQIQMADALQAYICTVQLNSQHVVGWIDLGILYESVSQLRDALKCYHQATLYMQPSIEKTSLVSRIQTLLMISQIYDTSKADKEKKLPALVDAFKLPIPLELVERAYQKGLISNKPACPSTPDFTQFALPSGVASGVTSTPTEPECQSRAADAFPVMSPWSLHDKVVFPTNTAPHNLGSLAVTLPSTVGTVESLSVQTASGSDKQTMWPTSAHLQQPTVAVGNQQPSDFIPTQANFPGNSCEPVTTQSDKHHSDLSPTWSGLPTRPESRSSELLHLMDLQPTEPLPDINVSVTKMFCPVSEGLSISPSLSALSSPTKGVQLPNDVLDTNIMADNTAGSVSSSNDRFNEADRNVSNWSGPVACDPNYAMGADESEYMQQTPMLPPIPPPRSSNLHPNVPTVDVQSPFDSHHPYVTYFCYNPNHPIVLIRSLAQAVNIDLNVFSSQSLSCANRNHLMDVRIQRKQSSDENWDLANKRQLWEFESTGSETTIGEYALYQERYSNVDTSTGDAHAGTARQSSQLQSLSPSATKRLDEGPPNSIKFGTNADLSDSVKWATQLAELQKLPEFAKVSSELNMLSYVDHTILGVNSVQLYMKVPGCRTSGHQENNNFCSVNLNVGPGDTEWFAVPNRYWGVLNTFCEKHKIDFLCGSWWPVLEDLKKEGVPVYRFLQKRGDLVWVNPGTPHWVQSTGICNNVAWNVGPLTGHQYRMAMERYEWNKIRRVKSIVPMIHLSWNIARFVKVTDSILYTRLRKYLTWSLQFCEYQAKRLKDEGLSIQWYGRDPGEPTHYCSVCEVEVFNILYVSTKTSKGGHYVWCEQCTRESDPQISEHSVLNQFSTEDLRTILNNFILHSAR